jgi:hypothetical protein
VLSSPSQGNLAVALLARSKGPLNEVRDALREANPGSVVEAFPSDTSPESLKAAFEDIKNHKSFEGLKLKMAIYSIKHANKKPFMEETYEVCFLLVHPSRCEIFFQGGPSDEGWDWSVTFA